MNGLPDSEVVVNQLTMTLDQESLRPQLVTYIKTNQGCKPSSDYIRELAEEIGISRGLCYDRKIGYASNCRKVCSSVDNRTAEGK